MSNTVNAPKESLSRLDTAYQVSLWLTAVIGLVLLCQTMQLLVHLVLALLLATVWLLCRFCWEKKAVRVILRILCSLPFVLAALFITEAILLLQTEGGTLDAVLASMTILGTPMLCYLTPMAAALQWRGSKYGRVLACFCHLWLVVLVALCCFTFMVDMLVWLWDNERGRWLWLAAAAVSAVLCYVPVLRPFFTRPAQKKDT